jgi:hypothetical protein
MQISGGRLATVEYGFNTFDTTGPAPQTRALSFTDLSQPPFGMLIAFPPGEGQITMLKSSVMKF